MHLPASEENETDSQNYQTTQPTPASSMPSGIPSEPQNKTAPVYPQSLRQAAPKLVPQSTPQPNTQQRGRQALNQTATQASSKPLPDPFTQGLRISSEPMTPAAAQAQAMLVDQTDGQLTQGLTIRYLPNATTAAPFPLPQTAGNSAGTRSATAGAPQQVASASSAAPAGVRSTYSETQYTPSAQDAAAGAYSAQKPINTAPPPPQLQPSPPQPSAQPTQTAQPSVPPLTGTKTGKRRKKTLPAPSGPSVPTLVTAPSQQPATQQPVTESPLPSQQSTRDGLTDQELQERNLPPLRGPWVRSIHRTPTMLDPRDEAEMQLRQIEGGYSAWLGGTGTIGRRTGTAGYDSLTTLESAFEASLPLGTKARLTFIARPVFLDSGQADGNAVITLTGGVSPEPFGTESGTVATTSGTLPPQQNAAGISGEAQLTFANLALAGGYTPYGFLVGNFIGRASWRPGHGPLTFTFNRDSVKDTQLSYSGLRDPGSSTVVFPGNIWGGVVANSANVQYARGDLSSGFYAGAGGQYITGYHVLDNRRYDGSMGAYFRVFTAPEYGTLNIGANFFAMHYKTNLQAFTYGMGGYFSPNAYFLANMPVTWTGHYMTRWHYNVLGSFGIQAFSQNSEPLYPLDQAIEISQNNPSLPSLTSVGPNYDLRGQVAYAVNDHWFIGGFAGANNSRNYTSVQAGFTIRYLFRSQPSTVAGPTGLFQTDDAHQLRPLTVP